MKIKRLAALVMAASMTVGAMALSISATEEELPVKDVIVEEGFDDYDIGWEAQNTQLSSAFTIEANSIGDGYIKVQEHPATGYLNLKSHVFTQIYNTTPIVGAYVFSLDIVQVQGKYACCVFLRAPKAGETAYYEADGYDENSCCRTGVVLYIRNDALEVNIKSFDRKQTETNFIGHNIFSIPYPEGVFFKSMEQSVNLKVVDLGNRMNIYIDDQLMCRIDLSEPADTGYSRVQVQDACYRAAAIYDAEGAELGTVQNPLIQSQGATVGWATRVADMIVDTVYLATLDVPEPETSAPTASETTPATEPSTESTNETEVPTANETDGATGSTGSTPSDETDGSAESSTEDSTDAASTGCASTLTAGAAALLFAAAAAVALKKKH